MSARKAAICIACVAWRFCRAGRTRGVAEKFAREARENERRSREKKKNQLLPPQSPRGFSALARLYYLATKTAMLRRLLSAWYTVNILTKSLALIWEIHITLNVYNHC